MVTQFRFLTHCQLLWVWDLLAKRTGYGRPYPLIPNSPGIQVIFCERHVAVKLDCPTPVFFFLFFIVFSLLSVIVIALMTLSLPLPKR